MTAQTEAPAQTADAPPTIGLERPLLENAMQDTEIHLRWGRRSLRRKRSLWALLWALLAGCGGNGFVSVSLSPPGAPKPLGLVEVSFTGIGQKLAASARRPDVSGLWVQSLLDVPEGVTATAVSSRP